MLLTVKNVSSGYYRKRVLRGVSLSVEAGEIVSLIGHNGAGKTTTLKTILGLVRAEEGEVVFRDRIITAQAAVENVRQGIHLIPQERFTFPDLPVRENLMLAAHGVRDRAVVESRVAEVYALFPILKARGAQRAGTMSGGQQRMLSMAMAMMAGPRLVMVDEPSLGLAPRIVGEIGAIVQRMAAAGIGVLLVDQNIKQTLRISHRTYVMKNGEIVLHEPSQALLQQGQWWDLY